jgi:hypothetical protein
MRAGYGKETPVTNDVSSCHGGAKRLHQEG